MYVVVVNHWGGIPGCLVERALRSLNHMKYATLCGKVKSRAYITNANHVQSFADIMNMSTDFNGTTLFHTFEKIGYRVKLFGAFGLNANLDPSSGRNFVLDAQHELAAHGIGTFSHTDGAYHKGCAYAHDEAVIQSALDFIMHDDSMTPTLLWFNLLSCADVLKRRVKMQSGDALLNGVNFAVWSSMVPDSPVDDRIVPSNVHSSLRGDKWNRVLRDTYQNNHKLYGETTQESTTTIHQKSKNFCKLLNSAWTDMCKLDKLVSNFLNVLYKHQKVQASCSLATHVFSLDEFQVRTLAPIESCCRSFWFVNDDTDGTWSSAPTSMLTFCDCLLTTLCKQVTSSPRPPITWKNVPIMQSVPLSTPTNVLDELLWLRIVHLSRGRLYSIVYSWSLRHFTSDTSKRGDSDVYNFCKMRTNWTVPQSCDLVSIHDLTSDPNEVLNISEDIKDGELYSTLADAGRQYLNANLAWIMQLKTLDTPSIAEKTPSQVHKKGILKFDVNPPEVAIVDRKEEPPPPSKVGNLSQAAKINLRRRESMLHVQHR